MMLRRVALLGCAITVRAQLPPVLEEAMDHIQPRARAELETFFAADGPHASFRIRIEEAASAAPSLPMIGRSSMFRSTPSGASNH